MKIIKKPSVYTHTYISRIFLSAVMAIALLLPSCSLEEENPVFVTRDDAFKTIEGLEQFVNYCYQPLNSALYNNADYLTASEAGTDLWTTANKKSYANQFFYYQDLNSTYNYVFKLWRAAYNNINICNTVIDNASVVENAAEEAVNAKAAEAYCLRAFYYSILVEQYGNVTLVLHESTAPDFYPKRSTVAEIYAQMVADLKYAETHLPVTAKPYGRVTKKTAKGLLAKVYLQGSAYDLMDGNKSYLQLAKETSEELILNMDTYGAGMYGTFKEVFSDANNRSNKEALFVSTNAVYGSDAANYASNCNHFRSFIPKIGYYSDLGTNMIEKGMVYGRANSWVFQPTKYLMDVFDDNDYRFNESFLTTYSSYSSVEWAMPAEKNGAVITNAICNKYGINAAFKGDTIWPAYDYNNARDVKRLDAKHTPYAVVDPLVREYPLPENTNDVAIYISKKKLSADEKARRPYFCVNIDEMYGSDGFVTDQVNIYTQICPALRKFMWSDAKLTQDYQYKRGDVFIMRMAEVYLIAAEANTLLGHTDVAAEQINVLRKRACSPENYVEGKMKVTSAQMNIDFMLDERARELCGEYSRWYDLKRTKKFEDRLKRYNPLAFASFVPNKHYLRPISQDFLNQIENREEYGQNPNY